MKLGRILRNRVGAPAPAGWVPEPRAPATVSEHN